MNAPAPLDALRSAFQHWSGQAPDTLVRAPGRVNLVGEHTDYNDGFCLPVAIDRWTWVALRLRTDTLVRVRALDLGPADDQFDLSAPLSPLPQPHWANYVRGVLHAVQSRGHPLRGMDIAITGNVPQGAGLSSSASLEVALGEALRLSHALPLSGHDLARIGQQAEHEFAGCNCGIMDQLCSALGQAGSAMLLDTRSLAVNAYPMPRELAVVVIESRIQRGLVDSAYNDRRRECEEAARALGLPSLREAQMADLARLEGTLQQRARHVITDSARAVRLAELLASGDVVAIGQLLREAHASQRDDFDISRPEMDALVDLCNTSIGPEGGARMTGGGFGGCVVALLPQARVPALQAALAAGYRAPDGKAAVLHLCQATAGAGPV